MNLKYLAAATAASALLGGAAYAQQPATTPAPETPAPSAESSTTVQTSTSSTSTSTTVTSATDAGAPVSVTTTLVTNGPVPDTAENRAKYGQPMSRAGKRTAARGN